MDQKRLLLAVSVSLVIMLAFTFIQDKFLPHPAPVPAQVQAPAMAAQSAGAPGTAQQAPAPGPRLAVDAPLMQGSIGLTGAVFDDVVLKQYHATVAPNSPLVQVMGRRGGDKPSYVQFGWSASAGVKVPDDSTVWSASAGTLTPQTPVTLSWDNGQGLTFQLQLAVDDKYMFTVTQNVVNHGAAPVQLYPWSRVVRDYKPKEQSSWVLFDGPLGVFNGTLKQVSYNSLKSDGSKAPGGTAYTETAPGGWIGITDKYWLSAVAPDQSASMTGSMSYGTVNDGDGSAYETSFITAAPLTAAPGGNAAFTSHVFTGAKVVKILDAYQSEYHIPNFYKAVDFGHLYFLTKPIFFALDYLNSLLGNFGLAILVFTVGVKLLFFPLASYSYRSMGKMRLVSRRSRRCASSTRTTRRSCSRRRWSCTRPRRSTRPRAACRCCCRSRCSSRSTRCIFITIEMRQAPFYRLDPRPLGA